MYEDGSTLNGLTSEVESLVAGNLVALACNFEVGRIVKLVCVFLYRSFLESRKCNSASALVLRKNFLALAVEFL